MPDTGRCRLFRLRPSADGRLFAKNDTTAAIAVTIVRMKRRAAVSALAVIAIGSSLHFTWELSGRNTIAAVFSSVNESTWEHLKMAFWPALALAPIHRLIYGDMPGFLFGTAIRCLLSPLIILALFYGYVAILGTNYLVLDICVFAVAVAAAEWAGHNAMRRHAGRAVQTAAAALLIIASAAFAAFTFSPPPNFLFRDSQRMGHIDYGSTH